MTGEKQRWRVRGWLRVVLSILGCVLALMGGFAVFAGLASLKEKPEQQVIAEKIYKVDVFVAEQMPLRELISGFGTSRAYREVVLSAEVGGRVVERHPNLKAGSRVTAPSVKTDAEGRTQPQSTGLPLVRIDPETYAVRVELAASRISEIEAELKVLDEQEKNNARLLKKAAADVELYEREYERIKNLGDRGVASKTQLTSARLELERYKQSVLSLENEQRLFPSRKEQLEQKKESAQADLNTAKLDLARTEVRPPFDGVLSEVSVEVGQNLRPGDPLVKLLDLDVIEIPVALPLGDYEKVAQLLNEGTIPTVRLARNTTSPAIWNGVIERVSPQADESTRTVEVYIRVENNKQTIPLLPGTFVHATIEGPVIPQAVALPRDCVIENTVYVANSGQAGRRRVTCGRNLQSMVLIEEGLQPGDQIIMTNLDILRDRLKDSDDAVVIEVQETKRLTDELETLQLPLIVPMQADRAGADEGSDRS